MNTMYKCSCCDEIFYENELENVETTYEKYYGVSDLFGDSHSLSYSVCPHCHSEEIAEEIPNIEVTDFYLDGENVIVKYNAYVGDKLYFKSDYSFDIELFSNVDLTLESIEDIVGDFLEENI